MKNLLAVIVHWLRPAPEYPAIYLKPVIGGPCDGEHWTRMCHPHWVVSHYERGWQFQYLYEYRDNAWRFLKAIPVVQLDEACKGK